MVTEFRGEYKFLSNFYICNITYNDVVAMSAEHHFQASKTIVPSEQRTVLRCPTPALAKKAGKMVSLKRDWDAVKFKIMEDIILAKFKQNPDLGEKLKATGTKKLIEGNTWRDYVWGVCNGRGLNLLGIILMDTRSKL